jgi:general secretion pathway protein D
MNNFKKITTASCFVVAGLSLVGCELLGPKPVAKLPLASVTKEQPDKQPDIVFKGLQNKTSVTEKMKPTSELYPGTDRFVSNSAQQNRRTNPTGAGSYSLNFDDADLGEVAKVILSDILGQNYVLSPKVAGKVTLQTTEPLTKEELLPTLEMVLRMNNAALVKDGRIYHIEPAAEALYTSDISTSRSGYQTRVIPVRNVAVQDIAEIIKPLVHEKTILNVDGARNILVASGTADEIARVMDMVSTFDIDVLKGRSFGLFPLAHVDPETVIKELEGIFYQKGKADESEFFQFIPIERLNAVLAITHQARYLEDIESWVFRLDKANTATGGGVNVYKVQHVDAVELADTLNEIFTGTAKKDKSAKIAPGQKSAEITNKQPSDKQPVKKSSASNKPTGDTNVSNVGEVRIISDEPNNSVIVVATAQEYEVILPIIKQLDVMPLQVLIDATIVEVSLKDELKYGMQWFFDTGNFKNLLTQVSKGELKDFGPLTGYSLLYTGGSVKAVLNALADKSLVNVIASPSLMVLNNQEGSINVGDKVPIATSQSTNTNSVNTSGLTNNNTNAIVSNQIQMIETGVTLKIKPRVNAGGLVIMDIEQEANQAVPTSTSTLNSPTIQQRKIKSSIVVKGGETIVLGGLIREEVDNTLTGIPYLSSLPIVGPLFGSTTKKNNRTELVVLITPRVVENERNARDVTNEFKRKLSGIYQDSSRGNYETTLDEEEKLIH